MGDLKKMPKYIKCDNYDLESVVLDKDHGSYKKGDKIEVHPNTAILYRFKGIVKEAKATKKPSKKEETK